MKAYCQTRKRSTYAMFALVFTLLMLVCSVVCVSLNDHFSFSWLPLRFEDPGRPVKAISALLPIVCAIVVLAACTALFAGLKPKNLLFAAGALLVFSIGRYVTDLYLTVRVNSEDFYVFSAEHIDLAFSAVIFLMTLLTVFNAFKSNALLTLTAMGLGLVSLVLTVLQVGSFVIGGTPDLSATVWYLSGCMAVALCALALEWNAPAEAQEPVTPGSQLQTPPVQAPVSTPQAQTPPVQAPEKPKDGQMPAPEPGYIWEAGGTEEDGTKLYVQRRIFRDIKTGLELPGPRSDLWYPHAPKSQLPMPAEGCIWEKAGTEPDGTQIYSERRMHYDAVTDRVIPGQLTGKRFPPVGKKEAPEPPAQQAQPSVPEQTAELLKQVESLHERGILSDDEYREKCRRILEHI